MRLTSGIWELRVLRVFDELEEVYVVSQGSSFLLYSKSTFNLDPPLYMTIHTLSVPYVSSSQYGIDSVCGLSSIGVGPD